MYARVGYVPAQLRLGPCLCIISKCEPRRKEEGDIRKLETKGVCLCAESFEFLVVEDRVVDCKWCFIPVALH